MAPQHDDSTRAFSEGRHVLIKTLPFVMFFVLIVCGVYHSKL
jgi:hypothetical protein